MKHNFFTLIFWVAVFTSGCCHDTPKLLQANNPRSLLKVYYATVDFQHHFNHTQIRLIVNGREEYAGVLTTDESTGVAKGMAIQTDTYDLEVEVWVNEKPFKFNVDLKKGQFLGFYLDSNGELHLNQDIYPFMYF